jgi:DNA-binding transcriptional MocR family regulator
VNENAATPTKPHASPLIPPDISTGLFAIALLSFLMGENSSARIETELRSWLAHAAPGERLPSTREIAARFGAGPVTVQKALRTLTSLGLVETRPGVGTFARATRRHQITDYGWQTAALPVVPISDHRGPSAMREAPVDAIRLHSGYPDHTLLPVSLVRAAFGRASRSSAALDRPPVAGLPELQAWFAAELSDSPGPVTASARDVVILPGSQVGISALLRAFVAPGQPMLIESPSYWGAILAARRAGVPLVPVPTGPDGPDPDVVDRAFQTSGARVFYAQPTFANPTGARWSTDRGNAMLTVLARRAAFLIEDDWAHDFGIDSDPTPLAARDHNGHVVYLRSLTKSVSPAMRVAAVIARGPAHSRILAEHAAESLYVSGHLQAAALDVLTQPGWRTHRRTLQHALRDRRDLLASSLIEHAPGVTFDRLPEGGLNLWARLPDGTDLDRVVADCERQGLLVAPGEDWFPAEPTGPHLRLNYAGPNPQAFPDAARILGDVLNH